jgi:HK97 family phage prohead protease
MSDEVFVANFQAEVLEAKEEDGVGKVKALVSAYNVDYRMGFTTNHRMQMGTFAKSLASNANVPLFWQHNWNYTEQPPIGIATGEETARGLVITGEFFLDTEAGRAVFNANKAGALKEWSIGYRIEKYNVASTTSEGVENWHVEEAELMEASSVLRGANPKTKTLTVASLFERSGLNVANEGQLVELIESFVAFIDEQTKVNEWVGAHMEQVDTWIAHTEDDIVALGDRTAKVEEAALPPLDDEAASSGGESDQTEAIVEGSDDGQEQEAASAPASKVPDLPSLPYVGLDGENDLAGRDDPEAVTRVSRLWLEAQNRAEVKELVRKRYERTGT